MFRGFADALRILALVHQTIAESYKLVAGILCLIGLLSAAVPAIVHWWQGPPEPVYGLARDSGVASFDAWEREVLAQARSEGK